MAKQPPPVVIDSFVAFVRNRSGSGGGDGRALRFHTASVWTTNIKSTLVRARSPIEAEPYFQRAMRTSKVRFP